MRIISPGFPLPAEDSPTWKPPSVSRTEASFNSSVNPDVLVYLLWDPSSLIISRLLGSPVGSLTDTTNLLNNG